MINTPDTIDNIFEQLNNIPHFNMDGRRHIYDIYKAFAELIDTDRWVLNKIYDYHYDNNGLCIKLPIISLKTKNTGNAIYITAGIHGEESAGPNALAESIDAFKEFECRGIPMIIYPICNPIGYIKDWRYPNLRRDRKDIDEYKSEHNPGGYYSVADVGHVVANPKKKPQSVPFYNKPINEDAGALTYHIIKNFEQYKPLAHFDLHEDDLMSPYVYSHGAGGVTDNIAIRICELMNKYFPIPSFFMTQYDQPVKKGITVAAVEGAIADIFSENILFIGDQWRINHPAKSVITLEIPMIQTPLIKRTALFGEIICELPEFYSILQDRDVNTFYS